MKINLFKGKSTHTKIYTLISIAAILVLLLLNLGLTVLGAQRLLFVDMTNEGFYTMTDKMNAACDEILNYEDSEGKKKQIKIIFCADPDVLTDSQDLRPTYFMALALRNRYGNVSVENVNLSVNPTAVSKYKTTSRQVITYDDIIFTYGDKYRVVDGGSFWTENYFSYNGEYRMVSIIASLTAVNKPKAYFVNNHGETVYDPQHPDSESSLATAALADLLTERGLDIDVLDLSREDVPEDCVLLIINNPTKDFVTNPDGYDRFDYVSELEKLDRYLVNRQGSVMFTKSYGFSMPVFESFAREWGIRFNNYLVKEDESFLAGVGEEGSAVIATYDTDETSYGYAYYEDYAKLSSAPKMIFTNSGFLTCSFVNGEVEMEAGTYNGSRTYATFIGTTDKATAYLGPDSTVIPNAACQAGEKALAAASVRTWLDPVTATTDYSYFFCANSADFLSNELLANESYANAGVLATVVSDLSRTERYASMELGGTSGNSPSYGGKQTVSTALSETDVTVYGNDEETKVKIIKTNYGVTDGFRVGVVILVCLLPLCALVAGTAVFIKRRFM